MAYPVAVAGIAGIDTLSDLRLCAYRRCRMSIAGLSRDYRGSPAPATR